MDESRLREAVKPLLDFVRQEEATYLEDSIPLSVFNCHDGKLSYCPTGVSLGQIRDLVLALGYSVSRPMACPCETQEPPCCPWVEPKILYAEVTDPTEKENQNGYEN